MNILIYIMAIAMMACGVYIIDSTDVQIVGGALLGLSLIAARLSGQVED